MCKEKRKLKYTTEEIVSLFNSKHNGRYTYPRFDYKGTDIKSSITCPVHGDFEQDAHSHLKGKGCPLCGKESVKLNKEEFVERATNIHGNKYDYTDTIITSSTAKAGIMCPRHGVFQQRPFSHLSGQGCPKCVREDSMITKEDFVKRAKAIHDDKYDYTETILKGMLSKATFRCPEHGYFTQKPNDHLGGHGCPLCGASTSERKVWETLTALGINFKKEFTIPDKENRYKYDFYLPDYRLLIELHGGHHYLPIDHWGGDSKFAKLQRRDIEKQTLAKTYNYTLVVIDLRRIKTDMLPYLVFRAIVGSNHQLTITRTEDNTELVDRLMEDLQTVIKDNPRVNIPVIIDNCANRPVK